MGYKPFGKNRVLVLPVPTSDMTAEEYKNAYGIELDSIEMRDLILVQEEDKEAYPVLYIDKENKVLYTADKAFSYASGFEVVESKSLISKVIETGTIENAKPIYWHTLFFKRQGANLQYFEGYMTILNNSDDPITVANFIKLFKTPGFYGVVINGVHEPTLGATEPTSSSNKLCAFRYSSDINVIPVIRDSDNKLSDLAYIGINASEWTINDLGVNKLN